ncbi:hypothetical protein [Nostoc sp.]|uniref:hypothetical protein n=1 Tax=Nostoc sp. TaxID=1180 RepID=UPI002FF878B4
MTLTKSFSLNPSVLRSNSFLVGSGYRFALEALLMVCLVDELKGGCDRAMLKNELSSMGN